MRSGGPGSQTPARTGDAIRGTRRTPTRHLADDLDPDRAEAGRAPRRLDRPGDGSTTLHAHALDVGDSTTERARRRLRLAARKSLRVDDQHRTISSSSRPISADADDHDPDDDRSEHDETLDDRLDRRATGVSTSPDQATLRMPRSGRREPREDEADDEDPDERAHQGLTRPSAGSRASRGTRWGSGRRSSSCSSRRSRAASAGSGAGR